MGDTRQLGWLVQLAQGMAEACAQACTVRQAMTGLLLVLVDKGAVSTAELAVHMPAGGAGAGSERVRCGAAQPSARGLRWPLRAGHEMLGELFLWPTGHTPETTLDAVAAIFSVALTDALATLPGAEPNGAQPVDLPSARQRPAGAGEGAAPPALPSGGALGASATSVRARHEATLLVAEDDPAVSQAMARLLEGTYRVFFAADGETALEMAKQHMPDVLISDVQMPGMDGIELSRRFRGLPKNRLAPVLLITGDSDLASRLAGFDAGAVDYILKPFEPAELLARLRSQLALRRLALRLSESEKLASLAALSASMAHELRNPANAVVNAIAPLVESLPAGSFAPGSAALELLEVIEQGAVQLRFLSQQILGFARPGQLVLREEQVATLVSRALTLVNSAMRRIDVRQTLHYSGPLMCAGPLMVQVLTNILENASHALQGQGSIDIVSSYQAEVVCIDIHDDGPGIDAALRERIFEPFFTTKPPGSGSGLGLSTARTILEHHGGSLELLNDAKGTTFRLTVPLGSAEPKSL